MSTIDRDLSSGELLDRVAEQEAELRELRARLAAWEARFDATPARAPSRPEVDHAVPASPFTTLSGLDVQPLYTPLDRPAVDAAEAAFYTERLGFPGEFPFTRGPYDTMYRTRLWTMRQFAGFGTAEE